MRGLAIATVLAGMAALPASALAADALRGNPYQDLFIAQLPGVPQAPPRPAPPVVQFAPQAAPIPSVQVRCGMTVLQGDAAIDPKMVQRLQIPPNGPTPTIRVVQPPICSTRR